MPLKYQKTDKVMIINILGSMSDQGKLAQLADELTDVCAEIGSNGETRVVILDGIEENALPMEGADAETMARSLSQPIASLDFPVIASINGDVIGIGLELALACDIRITKESSRFGLPHIRAGLIPWDGGTQRLSRLVGKGKALELILTGETIDAQEAFRIGLVSKVVPSDQLMVVAMDMAREMVSKSPIALRYAKEAIYKGMDLTMEQGLHLEADLYLLLHTTKDRTEGIDAFREKRTPKFEGK